MYQYKYVHLDTDDDFFTGPLKHRELIDQHAAEGWRYVGFFPTSFNVRGGISVVDLIFEREKEASS